VNQIRIAGGGLAGLALGIGLRERGIPVSIFEAADYPRHRVCGEFISGKGQMLLARRDLGDTLEGAFSNTTTAWFSGNRLLFARRLPRPAPGLSRYTLDQRLATRFRELGGELVTRRRLDEEARPGLVRACGRRQGSGKWIGLKLHCRYFQQDQDLSMHLGTHGYVGISRIENGMTNVCGLFRLRRDLAPGKSQMMDSYLRANSLESLADRLEAAEVDPASITATTASDFSHRHWERSAVCIGDHHTSIPPFAGNGMSMALESAEQVLPLLADYAEGEQSWAITCARAHSAISSRFRTRLAVARLLHPLLLQPTGRSPLQWAVAGHLVPFSMLFRLLR
jgi:menaquinone-9 beta-reductase